MNLHHQHSGHDHGHGHFGNHIHLQDPSIRNIRIAFFLNASMAIIEFIGAYFSNSVAIATDAVHDLGDSLALGLAWGLAYAASRKKTPLFTYGYQRLSLLGALINVIIIGVGSIVMIYHAAPRLWNPEPTHSPAMLGLAILGIAVNGYATHKTSQGKGFNEKVVSLHLLEDVLGWVAVAIASVVIMFTEFYILDPILSLLIVAYILRGVVKNFKATALLFLQATPPDIQTPTIEKVLNSHEGVKGIHDVHIWSLDGSKHVLSAHVVVGKKISTKRIAIMKNELKEKLKEKGINHATLEIELEDEGCQAIDSC